MNLRPILELVKLRRARWTEQEHCEARRIASVIRELFGSKPSHARLASFCYVEHVRLAIGSISDAKQAYWQHVIGHEVIAPYLTAALLSVEQTLKKDLIANLNDYCWIRNNGQSGMKGRIVA